MNPGFPVRTLAALTSSQCKQEDGTCDEMANEIHFKDRVRPEDSAKFKCEWRARFHFSRLARQCQL
jgi:hypothetical protein